jgi:hypothetical protein
MHTVGRPPVASPAAGVVLRVFWMFFGNAALCFVLLWIAFESRGSLSLGDAAFVAVVGALLLARYLDIARYDGATAEGAPATMVHFRRYAAGVIVLSLAVWAVLHGSAAL